MRTKRVSWFIQDISYPEAWTEANSTPHHMIGTGPICWGLRSALVLKVGSHLMAGIRSTFCTDSIYSSPSQDPAHFKHSNICWMNGWPSHWPQQFKDCEVLWKKKKVQISTTLWGVLKIFNPQSRYECFYMLGYRQWPSHSQGAHMSPVCLRLGETPDAAAFILVVSQQISTHHPKQSF